MRAAHLLALGAVVLGAALVWRARHATERVDPLGAVESLTPEAPLDSAELDAQASVTPDTNVRQAVAGGAAPAPEPSAPGPALIAGGRVTGRVIDGRSGPIEGALVRFLVPGRAAATTTSGADGRFLLVGVPFAPDQGTSGGLTAVAPDGRVAASVVPVPSEAAPQWWNDLELVVGPARGAPVVVRVSEDGEPVVEAEVELEAGFDRALVGLARTDRDGLASFDGVPLGSMLARAATTVGPIRRGSAAVPSSHPGGVPIAISLAPTRDVTVTVRETGTGAPRAGVVLRAERSVMPPRTSFREGDSWAPQERALAGGRALTGADGRATLRDLPREPLLVSASTDGNSGDSRRKRLGADDVEVTIEVEPAVLPRRVRWPIVNGERPAPPSGTRLVLRTEAGRTGSREPIDAVIVGTELVAERAPGGNLGLLATTADGDIARLVAGADVEVGREASFRRARTITVRAKDQAGAPLVGWRVGATNQGGNDLCEPVATDDLGAAALGGLHGGLADVWIAASGNPRGGSRVGSLDLEQGDGALEFTAAEQLRASLRVLVEGQPSLPPGLRLRPATVLAKEPAEARVEVGFELPPGELTRDVWVSAPGHTSAKVALSRGMPASVDVSLEREGALLVEVLRTPETRVELVAQRLQDDGRWSAPSPFQQSYPNADDGLFRLVTSPRGRFRAVDTSSGVTSEVVDVAPELGDVRVTLDLTRTGLARGVVTGPAGHDLGAARVIVEGAEVASAEDSWRLPPGTPPGSIAVDQNGVFSLPVDADRAVTLRVWHPELSASEDAGAVTLSGPREGLVLRLAVGPTCSWAFNAGGATTAMRVLLHRDAACTELVSVHSATIRDGRARCGGFVPGTYTLWIDPGQGYAPLTLPDVVLGEAHTDLGAAPFVVGSAVKLVIRVPPGTSAPRVFMSAFLEVPKGQERLQYNRQLNSRGEAEVVLPGLGPGTFRVRAGRVADSASRIERVITLDGARDEVIEVDL